MRTSFFVRLLLLFLQEGLRGKRERESGKPRISVRVTLVRRVKLFDEAGKELRMLEIASRLVVIHQIPAAATEHLPNRCRRKIRTFWHNLVSPQQGEHLVRIQKDTAIEWIDEEGFRRGEATYDEVPGQSDWFQIESKSFSDQEVDGAQRERNALSAGEHLIDETVQRIRVMVDVAVKTPLVEKDPVDHATLFPRRGGLSDEFATARGDAVQSRAAGADVESGRNRPA